MFSRHFGCNETKMGLNLVRCTPADETKSSWWQYNDAYDFVKKGDEFLVKESARPQRKSWLRLCAKCVGFSYSFTALRGTHDNTCCAWTVARRNFPRRAKTHYFRTVKAIKHRKCWYYARTTSAMSGGLWVAKLLQCTLFSYYYYTCWSVDAFHTCCSAPTPLTS